MAGRLRSYWDQDADAAFTHLETGEHHRVELTADGRKTVEFDKNGNVKGIRFRCCSGGVSMNHVPQEVREEGPGLWNGWTSWSGLEITEERERRCPHSGYRNLHHRPLPDRAGPAGLPRRHDRRRPGET